MSDEEIRMRCLELASVWEDDTVDRAKEYFDFVKGRSHENKIRLEKVSQERKD